MCYIDKKKHTGVHRGLFVDWYESIDANFYKIVVVMKRETMYQCQCFYQQPHSYIFWRYLHRYNFAEIFRLHITKIMALC